MAARHTDAITAADGLFVSCTNLATMDRIQAMEEALGKPVVTSNAATLWRALRAADMPTGDIGCGQLFTRKLVHQGPHPNPLAQAGEGGGNLI